ncbi:hypothetical protein [Bradyrhizobium sp.]|uniref:hypothetical protein n=1 Tax=Bradyrhizobium sp. TaxID=376 RepID=UPI003C71B24B
MKVLCAAAMIALLGGPAHAQGAVPGYGEPAKDKSPQEKASERDAEKAYQRSLNSIPEKAASDPWGAVRSESPPKAAAKSPAAKKTTTSGNPN